MSDVLAQDAAITVEAAAVSTVHSRRVARSTDPPPPPPRPPSVALTTDGELVIAAHGDRGPGLDELAAPTDDSELRPLPLPVYNQHSVPSDRPHWRFHGRYTVREIGRLP